MTAQTLFHEALAKPSNERAAFLDAACAGQPELRAAVEVLLAELVRPTALLDQRPAVPPTDATGTFGAGAPHTADGATADFASAGATTGAFDDAPKNRARSGATELGAV